MTNPDKKLRAIRMREDYFKGLCEDPALGDFLAVAAKGVAETEYFFYGLPIEMHKDGPDFEVVLA